MMDKPWPFALLALLWLAAGLAGGPAAAFDGAILSHFHLAGHDALVPATRFVTHLGGWMVLSVLALAGAVWLAARGRRADAAWLAGIVLGGRALVEAQKALIGRARPGLEHLVEVGSASFPSGHSANTLITGLALALLLSGRRWAVIAALAMAVAVGWSRMALGVHWPTDVVGGWAFAALWVLALLGLKARMA